MKDELLNLKLKLQELEKNKPKLYANSVEDVDDAYQERLEWTWERDELRSQIAEIEQMEETSEMNKLDNPIDEG